MTVGQPRRRISSRETTSQGSTRHLNMITLRSQLHRLMGIISKELSKQWNATLNKMKYPAEALKGLSHEIDFKNFDKNLQNLAKLRDAAGF